MRHQLTRAFSLLENLIALAVLSIGLLGSARLFSEALLQLHISSQRRTAVVFAEELIDYLAASNTADVRRSRCSIGIELCATDAGGETRLAEWHRTLQQALPAARAELSIGTTSATATLALSIDWPARQQPQSQHFLVTVRR